jgi:hypothetical protein
MWIYDLARFGGQIVVDVMRTHPMIIIGRVLHENPAARAASTRRCVQGRRQTCVSDAPTSRHVCHAVGTGFQTRDPSHLGCHEAGIRRARTFGHLSSPAGTWLKRHFKMKTYLMSLGAGILVGVIYSLLDVRSNKGAPRWHMFCPVAAARP